MPRRLYSVERRRRSVLVERNPNAIDLAQTGIVLVVGYALLAPGSDGASAFQHIIAAVRGGVQVGIPSLAAPLATPGTPPASNTPPAANTSQADQFSFGAAASGLSQAALRAHFSGDIGFRHMGPGGTFVLAVKVRNPGVSLFGITLGAGPWNPVLTTNYTVGNDQDWTGYDQPVDADSNFGQAAYGAEWTAEIWGPSNGVMYASAGTQPLGLGVL